MLIRKSYRFRLKPNKEAEEKFMIFAGHCRFVWNKALSLNLDRLERKLPIMWYYEMSFWLTRWKQSNEMSFLNQCYTDLLHRKLRILDRAFRDAFDKNRPNMFLPKFRKKDIHNSFQYFRGFKISNRRMYLPKIGWVSFFKSRKIEGTAKYVTLSKEGEHWYVSISVEREVGDIFHENSSMVGAHMGVRQLITLSNGTIYPPLNALEKYQKRVSREQRKLSRKEKGSKNREKQRYIFQKIHAKIRNSRKDYLHKISTEICKNHACIYIDKMKVNSMSRSARGTVENPGKNVKFNSLWNRSLRDQGWYQLRRYLEYKSLKLGGKVIAVDHSYTSQKCSQCHYITKDNKKSWSDFICQACGFSLHADINAARNILAAGHAVSVCREETLVSSMKQKPLRGREIVAA